MNVVGGGIHLASLKVGAKFSEKYHPGVWLSKTCRFSCCDSINKRSEGCSSSKAMVSFQVPDPLRHSAPYCLESSADCKLNK